MKLGRRFVGVPCTPGTLETPGAERLVVNLREFDCVTYIEVVLALAQMIRARENDSRRFSAGSPASATETERSTVTRVASTTSANGSGTTKSKRGLRAVTRELGGVRVNEPIDFMSSNADAYPALADPAELRAIRATETRLSAGPRYYTPQDRIRSVEERIRNGDIIAATTASRVSMSRIPASRSGSMAACT